ATDRHAGPRAKRECPFEAGAGEIVTEKLAAALIVGELGAGIGTQHDAAELRVIAELGPVAQPAVLLRSGEDLIALHVLVFIGVGVAGIRPDLLPSEPRFD